VQLQQMIRPQPVLVELVEQVQLMQPQLREQVVEVDQEKILLVVLVELVEQVQLMQPQLREQVVEVDQEKILLVVLVELVVVELGEQILRL
tara:strand:+ start:90 stop:362 length:273 start_codon:yes stop_codon:yes gene_type:complete